MKKILYLSLADWFWIKQRPQHICEGLSRNNEVVYFTNISMKNKYIHQSSQHTDEYSKKFNSFKVNDNLVVLRKMIIPFQWKFIFIKKMNNFRTRRYLEKLDKAYKFDSIIITNPNDLELLSEKLTQRKKLIYDCMDNYKEFLRNDRKTTSENEIKLLKIIDTVIVSSEDLYNELMKYKLNLKDKIFVVNNGVDIEKFNISKFDEKKVAKVFESDDKKKVCYIGTVSDWVNLPLISIIAQDYIDINFYFIGPIDENLKIDKYMDQKNMIFLGVQPYEDIPMILSNADIAIMPFILNDLVMSVNPVKIYEYLAMGKPTIATDYSETRRFGELIRLYNDEYDFRENLDLVLDEKESQLSKDKMIEFAQNNSWNKRVECFEKYI